MARKPRLHVPGALYHVTLRGNHQQSIFHARCDYRRLDEIVAEVLERFAAHLHAYCWMTNHVHLLVQVGAEPLGRLMLCIASRYARFAQRKLETTGHLFERRYHALLVDRDAYLLELVRYIHLNPVRAGLCTDAADYRWSSHRAYLGLAAQSWVTTEPTLRMFGKTAGDARARFVRFVRAGAATECPARLPPPNADDDRILGGQTFKANVRPISAIRAPISLEELAAQVCRDADMSLGLVRSTSRLRCLTPVRGEILAQALRLRVANAAQVARYFNRSLSAMCKLAAKYRQ